VREYFGVVEHAHLTRLDEKAKGVERVSVRISSWPYERTRQAR
jgi:hypothetical protein